MLIVSVPSSPHVVDGSWPRASRAVISYRPMTRRRLEIAFATICAAAVAVVGLLVASGQVYGPSIASRPPQPPAEPPPAISITVLNGTTTVGAALAQATHLTRLGYDVDQIGRAPAAVRLSQIDFAPGHRASALSVASRLGVDARSVVPLDPTDAAFAARRAEVVVTVGFRRS